MGAQYSQLVFQPSPSPSYSPEDLPDIVWIENSQYAGSSNPSRNSLESDSNIGRRIPSIFYEWKGRNGENAYFTILYSTGNGDDLYTTKNWAEILKNALNVNVFCYEYTGYGINRGARPSEKQCYEDIQTAYNYLTQTKKIPADQIILFGKSIGTGPTVNLASNLFSEIKEQMKSYTKTLGRRFTKRWSPDELNSMGREIAGVILQSPMTSVLDIHPEIKNALLSDMFENLKKIKAIRCNIMIVHGTKDQIIPIKHSKRLMKHIPDTTYSRFIELAGADHDDIESEYADEYLDELIEFINSITPKHISDEKRKNASIVPQEIVLSPFNVVTEWLSSINLQEYRDNFLGAGYYDDQALANLCDADLDSIGVQKVEDRRLILRHSAGTKPSAPSSPEKTPRSTFLYSTAPPNLTMTPKENGKEKDAISSPPKDSPPSTRESPKEKNFVSPPKDSKKEGGTLRNFIRRASTRKYSKEMLESLKRRNSSERGSLDSLSEHSTATSPNSNNNNIVPVVSNKKLDQLKIDFSPALSGGQTPPSSPRDFMGSPVMKDKWKQIDGMMNELAEKQTDEAPTSPLSYNDSKLEEFSDDSSSTPTRPRSLSIYKEVKIEKNVKSEKEREIKHIQTKLQLLEKIVVSQNELITSLNQKLQKVQQTSDEKDEVIRQLTESLTQVKTQLDSIPSSTVSSPASFKSPASTFSSYNEEKLTRKPSLVTEKRALYKAAYDQFVGELEKENGLTT